MPGEVCDSDHVLHDIQGITNRKATKQHSKKHITTCHSGTHFQSCSKSTKLVRSTVNEMGTDEIEAQGPWK